MALHAPATTAPRAPADTPAARAVIAPPASTESFVSVNFHGATVR